MTRNEAIDVLEWHKKFYDDGTPHTEAFNMAIEALYEDWIPCEERLPENRNIPYLISGKHNKMDFVSVDIGRCGQSGEWRFGDDSGICDFTVTAWQPLPKPYRAEREE